MVDLVIGLQMELHLLQQKMTVLMEEAYVKKLRLANLVIADMPFSATVGLTIIMTERNRYCHNSFRLATSVAASAGQRITTTSTIAIGTPSSANPLSFKTIQEPAAQTVSLVLNQPFPFCSHIH